MSHQQRDIGAVIQPAVGGTYFTAVAAGSGDASEVAGPSIDRQGLGAHYLSAKLCVPIAATLTSGKTVSFAGNWQGSSNDSDWTDYGTALAATVLGTGPSGGGAVAVVGEIDVDLSAAYRYVRVQYQVDLSHTGTDTATVGAATVVFGGGDLRPA